MTILYAGAYVHEAVLGLPESTPGYFDPLYAPYALKTFPYDGPVFMTFSPVLPAVPTYDNWIHFKMRRDGRTGVTGQVAEDYLTCYGVGGLVLFRLERGTNNSSLRLHGQAGGVTGTDITGLFPVGYLLTYDFHVTQNGSTRTASMYIDGILQATASVPAVPQVALESVRFTATNSDNTWSVSEMIMTDGEPTIGARLASQQPTGTAETNTWEGTWASLGDNDTGSGISTDTTGSRITGAFEAYTGTTSPVGIRAVVQANYFVDNVSGLAISSFLRAAGGPDNDTGVTERADASRVFTVWDQNPITNTDWTVSALSDVLGGVRSRDA